MPGAAQGSLQACFTSRRQVSWGHSQNVHSRRPHLHCLIASLPRCLVAHGVHRDSTLPPGAASPRQRHTEAIVNIAYSVLADRPDSTSGLCSVPSTIRPVCGPAACMPFGIRFACGIQNDHVHPLNRLVLNVPSWVGPVVTIQYIYLNTRSKTPQTSCALSGPLL